MLHRKIRNILLECKCRQEDFGNERMERFAKIENKTE